MVAAMELDGNPSSVHALGRLARHAVETARAHVAALIGGANDEIVFVSGGTEGDHLAIRGLALAARAAGRPARVVSSRLEHPAVAGALGELAREGFAVAHVTPTSDGRVTPEALAEALRDGAALVTLAWANHELGNLADVQALAAVARDAKALFHSDAVQAVGRVPVDATNAGPDALTVSAHKLGGPKGVGAVWLRRGVDAHPITPGGHQEHERRGGTENVVGIVGFGEACRLAAAEITEEAKRIAALRDRLEARLLAIAGARRNGDASRRVPGTCNVAFDGADGQLVAIGLDLEGVCVSTGSACTSGSLEPSPVLRALGSSAERAREAVRFSLGRGTTIEAIDRAAEVTAAVVARVRAATAC
jgi:cysteine desulfurase